MNERADSSDVIGVIGGGQLGRMLALAGVPLGFRFRFLESDPGCPAADVGEVIEGAYDDAAALSEFGQGLAVVTYEFENVPERAVRALAGSVPVHPDPRALAVAQDRLSEKEAFRRLGIATAAFEAISSPEELEAAASRIGLPVVLKTRRFGYDGKGQRVIQDTADLAAAWKDLGSVSLLVEEKVSFSRELSIVSVRGRAGDIRHYPVVQNLHRDGILHLSRAPAPQLTEPLQREAEEVSSRLLRDLDYIGVIAVELFDTARGLLANEMAPRVHNSGHWTQDGAFTSQFENHVRAVAGLPLGGTEARGYSAMRNLIGTSPPSQDILALPGCHLHMYGKTPRPGRKLGHVNVMGTTEGEVEARLADLEGVVGA